MLPKVCRAPPPGKQSDPPRWSNPEISRRKPIKIESWVLEMVALGLDWGGRTRCAIEGWLIVAMDADELLRRLGRKVWQGTNA